jgi:hypothetical protein
VIPRQLQPLVAKAVTSRIPSLPDHERDFLIDYFRERTLKLERLLAVRFDRWQR